MTRRIQTALISVYNKEGLEPIVRRLHELGVRIYSTGGTQIFIQSLGVPTQTVESITDYPAILGGRVKTLHPKVFGGILARRDHEDDQTQVQEYHIPLFDLVIIDLYPFEETVSQTSDEQTITDKIDIGGVSLIRAAAKNWNDVLIVSDVKQYPRLIELLAEQQGQTSQDDRRQFAAAAFTKTAHYDVAIADYFNGEDADRFLLAIEPKRALRYGENPHQQADFFGDLDGIFQQLSGKDLSYNNLADVDAACALVSDLTHYFHKGVFAIVKHTNVCGVALGDDVATAWNAAYGTDPESAFGGILITNLEIDSSVALLMDKLFFEVVIAPAFTPEAFEKLSAKKNRIILRQKRDVLAPRDYKRMLEGVIVQEKDDTVYADWNELGARAATTAETEDLMFANIVCKHLKSNAIALAKNATLVGKGCGQTSRIDAVRQAIDKARQFGHDLTGAVMASDAFLPFDDSATLAHQAGITAIIQPGGSIRDQDTIKYCIDHDIALIHTGMRHFKH